MEELIKSFVLLWAVIDPIGSIPVFIAVTKGHPSAVKRIIALQAILISTGILFFVLVVGQFFLEAMDIPLPAFQVSGGIILFLFALTMIFGESKPEEEIKIVKRGIDTAIFPMAVPSIASPGAMMAIVLLTDNHRFSIPEQALTAMVMLVVLAITFIFLLGASFIHRFIGDSGASIISRVMGLILGAVAANSVMDGIRNYFAL